MVSVISTIHVVEFFRLSNPEWLAITLAVSFEIGAAASLASIIALKKMNKTLIWSLFIILTCMQAMGNTYYAFVNLGNFSGWSELFDIDGEDLIFQKRILSILSGAILPIVALGFIKSLVDYLRPEDEVVVDNSLESKETQIKEEKDGDVVNSYDSKVNNMEYEDQVELDFGDSTSDVYGEAHNELLYNGIENSIINHENFSQSVQNANSNKGDRLIKRYPENL